MKENSFLSWLRRGERRQEEPAPHLAEDGQETPATPPAISHEPPLPPADLELAGDHALLWLWSLRNAEVGGLSPPRLSLSPPEGMPPIVSSETVSEELHRLERWLTETATGRMNQVVELTEDGTVPDVDAQGMVFVTRDGLSAWFMAYPPVGKGQELTEKMLVKALADENIVFGVDHALIDSLPERQDRYFQLYAIARGTAPSHGEDGYITELFPRKTERNFVVNEQNQVDYTALNIVHSVKEGETICKISPPTSGMPGVSVRGEVLSARDGKKAEVPKGRNTKLSEDGSCLVAVTDGHVEFTGRYFEVRCTLDIAGDVDYSTGNLNYLGDIHVHGDVRSGFTVRAMGNVRVDGVIEDTSVEAGGDLIVSGGVQGNGKAVIRAHHNIFAKYLENCSVHIQEDLYSDCVIHCEVYCDGGIHATTGRGAIIGGSIHSAGDVRTNVVGARTEVRTVIALGGRPCEDFERKEVLREIQEMELDREKTERQPDSPAKQKHMADLRLKTAVSHMKLESFKQKLTQHNEQPEASAGSRCLISKRIYPGTVISIDGYTRAVEQELHACTATLINEEVHFI